MRPCAEAVLSQLGDSDGELIVADASGLPVPEMAANENVRWLNLLRVPSYGLRQAGYRRARAPIVAITEDHCIPAADWLSAIIAEHERESRAAVVYGVVANGSREKIVDWALYSVGYLPWAPPMPAGRGAPGHANLSFKRWVFEVSPPLDDQVLEFRYVAALRDAGFRVIATNRTAVTHYQSAGLAATTRLLFHNGRLIAGLRRRRMTPRDWVRTLAPGLIAIHRTLRTAQVARTKPDIEARVLSSLPIVAVLHAAHALGEGVGYLGGPGNSGQQLH